VSQKVSQANIVLPVDSILPEIAASLARCSRLVIEAPPGAGKTTRVPPALLSTVSGDIIVLEPRRIAARLAARRVAAEVGEQVGGAVGYQVRFDEAVGPRTRLRFVTEGILTRRLITDPDLRGVDAVILDEFHERHLDSDLSLALLKQLQQRRPSLRIVVMSATLDAAPIAAYLDDCPVLRSEGRLFPLSIEHLPYSPLPLEQQVRAAVETLVREQGGSMLVFLPGAAEIRRAMRTCEPVANRYGVLMLPLHGDLTPAEQDRAVAPTPQRKLILATNVAESSITVDGVTAVIDSGLVRIASHSPWTGLPTLHIGRTSKASAEQRAGRAGRTAPGRVLRLYSREDFHARAAYDAPEIMRSDLSQLFLTLRAMGLTSGSIAWLEGPPSSAAQSAEALLDRLGATGAMAQTLARYPLPPRLSRVLVEAMRRGVGESGCIAAALLGSGEQCSTNDLLTAMEKPLDPRTLQQVEQIRRIARPAKQIAQNDDAVLMSILAGFPDRVARRRSGNQLLLSNGSSAEMAGEPPRYEFMVAVDAEDRKDKPLPLVRMAARIEPEWLIDVFPEHVAEQSMLEWNREAERVETVSRLMYDELVIQESRSHPANEAVAIVLAGKAIEAGIGRFVDESALGELMARIRFAGGDVPDIAETLRELCHGLRSFTELQSAATGLLDLVKQKAGRLDETAPERIRLLNGRLLKIHYEDEKPPWIASRLQDFFGMKETPRIGPGRTPVVVHLLAPNKRAVQMTTDLAGFWERLYPQVRRELMRRYPRHDWRENPNG
jgi:ATP-dependent helicase HrpB